MLGHRPPATLLTATWQERTPTAHFCNENQDRWRQLGARWVAVVAAAGSCAGQSRGYPCPHFTPRSRSTASSSCSSMPLALSIAAISSTKPTLDFVRGPLV